MTKDTQSGKRSIRNSGQYASNIKKLRLEAGLTASQLAEAIGVTKNAIYNWEAGSHRPDLDTLPQLCDALMVTADELLGHSTPNMNLSEHQLLCIKHGVVADSYSCRKYRYDPCKRVPPCVKAPDFDKYKDEDFNL